MRQHALRLIVVLMSLMLVGIIRAQDITPLTPPDPNNQLAITFPPAVALVRGQVDIRGSANIADLSNYFVEFRPIVEVLDPAAPDNRPWFPATLPSNQAVQSGVLGTWNTETTNDGLYEIRLTVNTATGTQFFRVSPVRVLNQPAGELAFFETILGSAAPVSTPTQAFAALATPTQFGNAPVRPPLAATPTPIFSTSGEPIVTAQIDSNVRTGDSTSYPVVGALLEGESARVVGISTSGSGWYYIELENGRRGFVAPGIVRFEGNPNGLQRISPPATPTPTPTNTPVPTGNLQITGLELQPATPQCAETFEVYINIANTGTSATSTGGSILVRDRNVRTGDITATGTTTFPALQPGENFLRIIPLTVDTYFDETHQVIVTVDSNNEVRETNETDNQRTITYDLGQSTCG